MQIPHRKDLILPAVYRDGETFGKRDDVFSPLPGRSRKRGGGGVDGGRRVFLCGDWRRRKTLSAALSRHSPDFSLETAEIFTHLFPQQVQ